MAPVKSSNPSWRNWSRIITLVLAKIDTDCNPNLAGTYKIAGVPDVRIVHQGEVLPGFVGVLPEAELRQLLAKLGLSSAYETGLDAIERAIAGNNPDHATVLFESLLMQYPERPELTLKAAKFFLTLDQIVRAESLLARIQTEDREYSPQAQALKQLIRFKHEVQHSGKSELEQSYTQACQYALNQEYEKALDLFLKIVSQNPQYKDDGARKAMVALFKLLGHEHPVTKEYRQRLMLQLY